MSARACRWCGDELPHDPSRAPGGRVRVYCDDRCRSDFNHARRSWDDTPTHRECGGRLHATSARLPPTWAVQDNDTMPPVWHPGGGPLVECARCHQLYPAGDGRWSQPNPWPGPPATKRAPAPAHDSTPPSSALRSATQNQHARWSEGRVAYMLTLRVDDGGAGWELYADDVDVAVGELHTAPSLVELRAEVMKHAGIRVPLDVTWHAGLW